MFSSDIGRCEPGNMEVDKAVMMSTVKAYQVGELPSPPSETTPPISQPSHSPYESDDSIQNDVQYRRTRVVNGLHVLGTEANALAQLYELYRQNEAVQEQFSRAVDAIAWSYSCKAQLIFTGIGKSGHIARKLVSTFQSLGISSTFLHPTDALHGDLGTVGKQDTVVFITFSGKTEELQQLMPHLHQSVSIVVLTSHLHRAECELLRTRPGGILLSAPLQESETTSFGVAAPTTSTTVALALGDALAIATSKEIHADVPSVFARNHPGGAIGASLRSWQE